jgi:hypothetical protein
MASETQLTTRCVCQAFDDEKGEWLDTPSEVCFGDCWQDQLDDLRENFLNSWRDANNFDDDTIVKISGAAMSWRRVAGETNVPLSKLPEVFFIDGEFTLRFLFSDGDKDLQVVRYSHDEHGASFEITKSQKEKCAFCGEIELCELTLEGSGEPDPTCAHCREWHGLEILQAVIVK